MMPPDEEEDVKFAEPQLPTFRPIEGAKIYHSPYKDEYLKLMNFGDIVSLRESLVKQLKKYHIYEESMQSSKPINFLNINSSKYCEIIELDVNICWLLFKIRIINIKEESPIHACTCIGSGTYGKIYRYESLNSARAVKCFQINQKDGLEDYLTLAITEYCILKTASIIRSGPEINQQGFNLYVYKQEIKQKEDDIVEKKYCIEFQTEFCDSQMKFSSEDHQSLFRSLYYLHVLGITHCDIKPENIMYSFTLNKWIFIDFGISSILKETIGESSKTKYRGTPKYSGEQMKQLYSSMYSDKDQSEKYIDLYWNDVYGLKLTCEDLEKRVISSQMKKFNLVDEAVNEKILQHFLIINFKYCLYFGSQLTQEFFIQNIKWDKERRLNMVYFLYQLRYLPEKIRGLFANFLQSHKMEGLELKALQKILAEIKSTLKYDQEQEKRYMEEATPKHSFFREIPQSLQSVKLQDYKNEHLLKIYKSKQVENVLYYLRNFKNQSHSKEQQQLYLPVLLNAVSFVRNKKFKISLDEKKQICRVYYFYNNEKIELNSELGYIRYFINKALNICLQSQQSSLKNFILEIYTNFLILGLGTIQSIKRVYSTIIKASSNISKVCQYFLQIYNLNFWYQQQIYEEQEQINFIELKEYILTVMHSIYLMLQLPQNQQHRNCKHPLGFCEDMESYMLKRIEYEAKALKFNHNNKQSQFQQKIRKCLQTLKVFRVKMQQADAQIKIKDVFHEIPLNLKHFYIPQLLHLNQESWARVTYFIEHFIESPAITKRWAIALKMKCFYIYHQNEVFDNVDAFNDIKSVLPNYVMKNMKRFITIYDIAIQSIYAEELTMELEQERRFNMIKLYEEQMVQLGNLYTEDELAYYLIKLQEPVSRSIWHYLNIIRGTDHQRVKAILICYYNKILNENCFIRKQHKLLKLAEFVLLKKIELPVISFNQCQITECKEAGVLLDIKIKYFEQKILSLQSNPEQQSYLMLFYYILKRTNRYRDYLLKNIFYVVILEMISLLIRKQMLEEAVDLICKLSEDLLYLLSKQTVILDRKIKTHFMEMFIAKRYLYFKYYEKFRDIFLKRSLKNNDIIPQYYNESLLKIEQSAYEYTQTYYTKGVPLLKPPEKFKFLSYTDYRKVLSQIPKIISSKIPVFQIYDVQTYYRLFVYMIKLHPQSYWQLSPRYKRFIYNLHRRALIITLPWTLELALEHYKSKYLAKKEYYINIFIKRSVDDPWRLTELLAKEKFKEKLNKTLVPYLGIVIKRVRYIR